MRYLYAPQSLTFAGAGALEFRSKSHGPLFGTEALEQVERAAVLTVHAGDAGLQLLL